MENLIEDRRTQKRRIIIDLTSEVYEPTLNLDKLIDMILPDLKIVISQREMYETKIKITLE